MIIEIILKFLAFCFYLSTNISLLRLIILTLLTIQENY